jgi:hypothetical protein
MLIVPFLVMATYFLGKEVPKDGLRLRLTCNWQPRQPPPPSAGAPCRRPPFQTRSTSQIKLGRPPDRHAPTPVGHGRRPGRNLVGAAPATAQG